MTREQVLAHIAAEFKDLLTSTNVLAADSPTAFKFVIDDALFWGGDDEGGIKACAKFFALRRFEAAILASGVLPEDFKERMSEAKELCAEYPFAQE